MWQCTTIYYSSAPEWTYPSGPEWIYRCRYLRRIKYRVTPVLLSRHTTRTSTSENRIGSYFNHLPMTSNLPSNLSLGSWCNWHNRFGDTWEVYLYNSKCRTNSVHGMTVPNPSGPQSMFRRESMTEWISWPTLLPYRRRDRHSPRGLQKDNGFDTVLTE